MDKTSLIVVLGPTGSGKSEAALRIAETFGGEIIGCDSLQVYRHFDVGTAKFSLKDRRGIPHHLVDFVEPLEIFTAGEYSRAARQAFCEITRKGRRAVVAGGTGFYLRAFLEGLSPGPARDVDLRNSLTARERHRPGSLHRILRRVDPATASRVHPNDVNKTMRALEVRILAGRPISELFAAGREPLPDFGVLKIGLNPPRAELYRRLDARTVSIFQQGLLEEVRALLARGVPRTAKPFESLGYRQALQVLDGYLTIDGAIASTQLDTRRYAKRQMTWFRREPNVQWLEGFGDDPAVQASMFEHISSALGTTPLLE